MVGIRLGNDLEQKINLISQTLRRPKSSLIREAIETQMEEWEDMVIIIESLHDKGKRWTLNELMQRYDVRPGGLES